MEDMDHAYIYIYRMVCTYHEHMGTCSNMPVHVPCCVCNVLMVNTGVHSKHTSTTYRAHSIPIHIHTTHMHFYVCSHTGHRCTHTHVYTHIRLRAVHMSIHILILYTCTQPHMPSHYTCTHIVTTYLLTSSHSLMQPHILYICAHTSSHISSHYTHMHTLT